MIKTLKIIIKIISSFNFFSFKINIINIKICKNILLELNIQQSIKSKSVHFNDIASYHDSNSYRSSSG